MSTTTIIPNTTKWLSDDALADRWEVTVRTIQRWERDDPDFPRETKRLPLGVILLGNNASWISTLLRLR